MSHTVPVGPVRHPTLEHWTVAGCAARAGLDRSTELQVGPVLILLSSLVSGMLD